MQLKENLYLWFLHHLFVKMLEENEYDHDNIISAPA